MTSETQHLLRLYDQSSRVQADLATSVTNMQQAVDARKNDEGHLEPRVATAILATFKCAETHKAVVMCVAEHLEAARKQEEGRQDNEEMRGD